MSPCFSSQGAFGHAFGHAFSFVSLWLCRRSWQFEVPSSSLGRRMGFRFGSLCIALGWPSHHFAPFVMFVLSCFISFYHWFIIVLFVLLLYVLLCLYVSVKFPDHRRSPVWSVPYSHELLQRSLQTSRCRFFLRWCWAASQGVNPWQQRLALSALSARTWCRHDQFPTCQHWANMIHGRPFRSRKFGFSSYWKIAIQ